MISHFGVYPLGAIDSRFFLLYVFFDLARFPRAVPKAVPKAVPNGAERCLTVCSSPAVPKGWGAKSWRRCAYGCVPKSRQSMKKIMNLIFLQNPRPGCARKNQQFSSLFAHPRKRYLVVSSFHHFFACFATRGSTNMATRGQSLFSKFLKPIKIILSKTFTKKHTKKIMKVRFKGVEKC